MDKRDTATEMVIRLEVDQCLINVGFSRQKGNDMG